MIILRKKKQEKYEPTSPPKVSDELVG